MKNNNVYIADKLGFHLPKIILRVCLYRNDNNIPKVNLIIHTICVMVEGIAVTLTNWSMFQKLNIADKCWLDICPIAENCCMHQIGQCKLTNEMLWFHINIYQVKGLAVTVRLKNIYYNIYIPDKQWFTSC